MRNQDSSMIVALATKLWERHNEKCLTKIAFNDLTPKVQKMYFEDVMQVLCDYQEFKNKK